MQDLISAVGISL